jgi:hypothetical protein
MKTFDLTKSLQSKAIPESTFIALTVVTCPKPANQNGIWKK